MLITSAGIYGFLSNAYQKTANKLEIHEGELGVLDGKKNIFQKSIDDNQKIIDSKNKRLDQLSGLRTSQESRIDGSKSNRDRNSVRSDIASANTEIQKLSSEIDVLNNKNAMLSDSIGNYNVKSLEMKSGSDVSGEVGPLKYIAELTGVSMAKVVNYLILLLIFVFDPLAISLVLATNKAFDLVGESTPLEPKKHSRKEVLKELKDENEGVNMNPETGEIIFPKELSPIETDIFIPEATIEMPTNNPIMSSGKIALADIKEIKEGQRGYSVNVPQPKLNNTIERIGSNKVIKDGNNNKFFFKRK